MEKAKLAELGQNETIASFISKPNKKKKKKKKKKKLPCHIETKWNRPSQSGKDVDQETKSGCRKVIGSIQPK